MLNRKFRKKNEFSITHQFGFATIAIVCFFTLYAPISILVFYSFNAGNNLMLWEGFSLNWYVQASKNELVQEAAIRSVIIAVWASLISTLVATMAALGTTRTRPFKGQKSILKDTFDLWRALGSIRNGFVFRFPRKWWYREVEGSFLSPFHDHF